MRRLVLLSVAALVASSLNAQTILHVRAGATGGDGSCASPLGSVADALAAARTAPGPVTLRLAGTFRESGLLADVDGLSVEGGYDGASFAAGCTAGSVTRDPAAHETVLDGDADGDGRGDARLVDVASGTSVTFDGLTFTHGRAGGSASPLPPKEGSGGALRVLNASATLTRCLFRTNETTQHQAGGGAILVAGIPTGATPGIASLTMSDCVFDSNRAGDGSTSSGSGGAIAAWDFNVPAGLPGGTTVSATRCTFTSNVSKGSGPLDATQWCAGFDGTLPPQPNLDCAPRDGAPDRCASRAVGGAVTLQDVSGTWVGNAFEANAAAAASVGAVDASGQGGALASVSSLLDPPGPQPVITNNVFRDNQAIAGPGTSSGCGAISGWGGAAYLANFASRLEGNVFEGNVADASRAANSSLQIADGGAVAFIGMGSARLHDNRFTSNQALGGRGTALAGSGGGLYVQDGFSAGRPVITQNVFGTNLASGTQSSSGYGGGLFVSSAGNVLLARNRFDANEASAPAGLIAGVGGAAWIQLGRSLVADNVVTGNLGNNVATGGELRFGGLVFIALAPADPSIAPRVQNNLIVTNQGAGLATVGFPSDLDGDGATTVPDEVFYCSPDLRQNTIALNSGPALATNQSDDMVLDGDVLWGNDTNGTGTGDWYDGFIGNPSPGVVVSHSLLSSWNSSVDASVRDPFNANLLGVDPLFVDSAAGDFHLSQAPDESVTSPCVDAGSIDAASVDYGGGLFEPDFGATPVPYAGDALPGTTQALSGWEDAGVVDLGWHSVATGAPPPVRLLINEAIVALSGGTDSGCGPRTWPALSAQVAACAPWPGCATPSVVATRTLPWSGSPVTLPGEAAPSSWALVLYEVEGCAGELRLVKQSADVVVNVR